MSKFSTREGGAGQIIANVLEHSLCSVDLKHYGLSINYCKLTLLFVLLKF